MVVFVKGSGSTETERGADLLWWLAGWQTSTKSKRIQRSQNKLV